MSNIEHNIETTEYRQRFQEIRQLIDTAKQRAAVAVNAEPCFIGKSANAFKPKFYGAIALNMANKLSIPFPNNSPKPTGKDGEPDNYANAFILPQLSPT